MACKETGFTFLFLSITDWDAPQFGSRQQIARQLARRGHRVLYVELPRALHSLISDFRGTSKAWGRFGQIREVAEGLMVYTPLPVLPVYYNPITNWTNQHLLRWYLKQALAKLNWAVDVLWTFWPNTGALIGTLGEQASVYHCIDNFTAVSYPLTSKGTIARLEADQCRKVDLIFTRTSGLAADKRRYNPNTFLLPGGVDVEHFDPKKTTLLPPGISDIPTPRIGFLGTLDVRLDSELLLYCIQALPEASFVFVGPIRRHLVDVSPLRACSNVHFLPPCPHANAPDVVASFDICLIPYRINEYTRELSPIKLYEYLAMGKPVVSTNLPYTRREQKHICLAESKEHFSTCLTDCLAQPPTTLQQNQWREVAQANAWGKQVDEIESRLAAIMG